MELLTSFTSTHKMLVHGLAWWPVKFFPNAEFTLNKIMMDLQAAILFSIAQCFLVAAIPYGHHFPVSFSRSLPQSNLLIRTQLSPKSINNRAFVDEMPSTKLKALNRFGLGRRVVGYKVEMQGSTRSLLLQLFANALVKAGKLKD
jgi:hypothetical protein